MSSSGLIYAAIVGAWAAYLVPMWLRRQDELNESRHTERFTTAIRILSRRGALERRYARMIADGDDGLAASSFALPARTSDEPQAKRADAGRGDPVVSDPGRPDTGGGGPGAPDQTDTAARRRKDTSAAQAPRARQVHASVDDTGRAATGDGAFERSRGGSPRPKPGTGKGEQQGARRTSSAQPGRDAGRQPGRDTGKQQVAGGPAASARTGATGKTTRPTGSAGSTGKTAVPSGSPGKTGVPGGSTGKAAVPTGSGRVGSTGKTAVPKPSASGRIPAPSAPGAPARRRFGLGRPQSAKPPAALKRPDGRAKLLARRRRVVVGLFLLFTAGAVVTGLTGLARLWVPALPGLALTGYIGYLRVQERRRYEATLRNRLRPAPPRPARKPAEPEPRRTPSAEPTGRRAGTDQPGPTRTAGDRPPAPDPRARATRREAEERDHADWIAALQSDQDATHDRDAWDPVPVPLPTYVTAPVVPRGDPAPLTHEDPPAPQADHPQPAPPTPLFDQYAEDPRRTLGPPPVYEQEWPRAGNE
ncbi:hypothetical protein [Yinghuangia seranimata]|uniref:hypothetical protein n=1 Tax=Yinghuangia seranimata TaxID=408067 RepID=UPI00248C7F17|nr:hypothetical protein [Yinghuangia seranimata]MDI2128775.1 hypothetical protein [Yinghuangia seranimata]